jgi:CBS domain-containing protein
MSNDKDVNRNGQVRGYPGPAQGQPRDTGNLNQQGRGSTGFPGSSESVMNNLASDRPFRRLSRGDGSSSDRDFRPASYRDRDRENFEVQRMDDEGGAQEYRDWRDEERDPSWQNARSQYGRYGGPNRGYDRGEERHARDDRAERPRAERSSFRKKWWQRESPSVADVMTKDVKTVGSDASIRDVAEIMLHEDVGVVPIVREDGRLHGLVTDRDIVVRGIAGGKPIDQLRAQDLATTDIEVASAEDSLSDVIHLMGRQQIRRVPVVDDRDHLVGIVSLGDIANRADQDEELQSALEKISGRRSFWNRIWR